MERIPPGSIVDFIASRGRHGGISNIRPPIPTKAPPKPTKSKAFSAGVDPALAAAHERQRLQKALSPATVYGQRIALAAGMQAPEAIETHFKATLPDPAAIYATRRQHHGQ